MKKMILMLIVVGILIFGTFGVAEEICENISSRDADVSEEGFEEMLENIVPCGGGNGGGGIPG